MKIRHILAALLASVAMFAEDLPADVQAKLVKILASNAGSGAKILCRDAAMAAALKGAGMAIDPGAKVAWGANEAEVKSLRTSGKLVICGKLEYLPAGGSMAVVEEGGKPQIYLHMGNIAASGVTVSDAIMKIGKKL